MFLPLTQHSGERTRSHFNAFIIAAYYCVKCIILSFILFINNSLDVSADDTPSFNISLESRWRFEVLQNQFRSGLGKNDQLLANRNLLKITNRPKPSQSRFYWTGEIIDARVYLDDQNTPLSTGFVNTVDILQAYAGYDLANISRHIKQGYVRIGRFTKRFQAGRLMTRNGFRNTINAFTGIDSYIKLENQQAYHAFIVLPVTRTPLDRLALSRNAHKFDTESDDLIFWGISHDRPFGQTRARLSLTLLGLHEQAETDQAHPPTLSRQLYTPHIRLFKPPVTGNWDYDIEGAFQFGRSRDQRTLSAPIKDVRAHMLHAELGYSAATGAGWQLRTALQLDLISGDNDPNDDQLNRFDPLFGGRRGDFGHTSSFGALRRQNLRAIGAKVMFTGPKQRTSGRLMWQYAELNSATDIGGGSRITDPTGQSGRKYGHILNGHIGYDLIPGHLHAEIGGAVLLKGHFLKAAPNAPNTGNSLYSYFQLTAKF